MNHPIDQIEITQSGSESRNDTVVDMASIVNDMLALKMLLENETEWLKAMQVDKVAEVHDEKIRLIRRLEIQKDLVSRDPSLISQINAEERHYLKELQSEIDNVVHSNFIEVFKAREINRRVVETISQAVCEHEKRASGYDGGGAAYDGSGKSASDEAYAVTLSQTI